MNISAARLLLGVRLGLAFGLAAALLPVSSGAAPGEPADAAWPADARLELAEKTIPGRVQVLNTRHFRAYLPAETPTDVQAMLDAMSRAWDFYAGTLASLLPIPQEHDDVTVFALDGADALDTFVAGLPFTLDRRRPGLVWNSSPSLIAFDWSTVLGPSDLGVLLGAVVQVAHDGLLYEPGVAGSWWVREGFAVYVTQTRRDSAGSFDRGKVRTSEGYIDDVTPRGRMADGLEFVEEPRVSLKAARKAYRRGRHVPLQDLLAVQGRAAWSDEATRETASVQSWALIHFLLHGRQGELRPRPAAFLARERRGDGGPETFRKTVSGDIARFESFLYAHMKTMK